jgi:hypothetical protein
LAEGKKWTGQMVQSKGEVVNSSHMGIHSKQRLTLISIVENHCRPKNARLKRKLRKVT